MTDTRSLFVSLAALAGCTGDGPHFDIAPDHGDQFGHYDVALAGELAPLGDISSVTVGGIRAYAIRPQADGLVATLQGAPSPGAADVVIEGTRGRAIRRGAFTFDAPAAGVPAKWLAFGASLTQGTQSLGINVHSQLHGVSGVIAKQAGAFLAVPLFADGVLPGLQIADFGPDCTTPKGESDFIPGLFTALTDPHTGLVDLKLGRVDPTLAPRDFAIGGSKVSDIVDGGTGTLALLEHLVEEPTTTSPDHILATIDHSQLARIEMFDPDIAFTTDLLGNDVDPAVTGSDDLHPELVTPLATVQPLLAELVGRLGELHGHYFIANLPYLTFVPNVATLRARRIAAGTDTAETFDAKVQQIDALVDAYNAALVAAVAPYPNLHLVDFQGQVQAVRTTGVTAGGEPLTVAHLGGLLSLDDLHFTDTGYALLANVFIDAIDQVLGISIPHADVDAIHAGDALAPSQMRAAGLTCVPPT